MFNFIWKRTCRHDLNVQTITWLEKDGCPMVETNCLDCDFVDYGPVIMPLPAPADYCRVILVKNGRKVVDKVVKNPETS